MLGANGILLNWAYYFVYNTIGWGGMWIKISLWQSYIFKSDSYFFPFMMAKEGVLNLTHRSLFAFLCPEIFSTCFYMFGYYIFRNPVPIGTITFGVPSFVVSFVSCYFFVIPAEKRQTFADHTRIVRTWAAFVIWVVLLCLYICLTWLLNFKARQIENQYGYFAATIGLQILFIAIRDIACAIPSDMLMGCVNHDMHFLWNIAFAAMYTSFTDWMFPGMPQNTQGYTAAALIIIVEVLLSYLEFRNMVSDFEGIGEMLICQIVDVISGVAFIMIFAYNVFGPNKEYIYVIADMSTGQCINALGMISLNLVINTIKLGITLTVVPKKIPHEILHEEKIFALKILRVYYWPVIWLLISTCMACGACMVMKHDGMDMSFKFDMWAKPNSNITVVS